MKKTKVSKRLLSILMALLMIVTIIPMGAFTASALTDWSLVASTDFTGLTWSDTVGTDGSNKVFTTTASPTTSEGGNTLQWTAYRWDNSTAPTIDSNGFNAANSFLFLSGYNGGTSTKPFASQFKIDVQFRYTDESYGGGQQITDRDGAVNTHYTFLKLSQHSNYDFKYYSEGTWENEFFTQEVWGRTHNAAADDATRIEGQNYCMATYNPKINIGTDYHYIMYYANGMVASYVTDARGDVVLDFGAYACTLTPSNITGLYLGNSNGYYLTNVAYKNIKIYSGTNSGTSYTNNTKSKFLFAYFTGQGDSEGNGEKIRLAVSSDGYNWEALNGNDPVFNNVPSEYLYNGDTVGLKASGRARDPFIIQKRTATGEVTDGYYVLATDLQVGLAKTEGWTNQSDTYVNTKLLVWSLDDITDAGSVSPWSLETMPWFGITEDNQKDFQAWAPEAIWDPNMNMYMMYWSTGGADGYSAIRVHYAYTNDFRVFYDAGGNQIGVNGVEPDVLLNPQFNNDPTNTNNRSIDANITFDGDKYWCYFKREAEQQIYYCYSEKANGPYTRPVKFSVSGYSNSLEGCEVYQLKNGNYMLMMDYYSNNGNFLTFESATIDGFDGSSQTTTHMNHLSPRHGQVTYIDDDEYYDLIATFGKNSWCDSNIEPGKTANDYLIARYFTNNDVFDDASGNNNNLSSTSNNFDMVANFNGKVAVDCVTVAGQYGCVDTSDWDDDYGLNVNDGITFDWWSYTPSGCNSVCQLFDWTSSEKNVINNGHSTSDTNYVFLNAGGRLEANYGNGSSNTINTYDRTTLRNDTWHHYTVSISKNSIAYYIDGTLDYVTNQGPYTANAITDAFFDEANYLYIGASSYSGDPDYYGYFHDFKVYSRALSMDDVTASIAELTADDEGVAVNDTIAPAFYDPMENMEAAKSLDGAAKTVYSASTDDATYGKVLNTRNGVVTHNGTGTDNMYYNGSATDPSKGYTISFWYNPGAATAGYQPIFKIGVVDPAAGTEWSTGRNVFSLSKDGAIFYYYNNSNGDCEYNTIGTYSLTGDSAKTPLNTYTHITIKVIPDGDYEILKTYINGELYSTFRNFTRNQFAATGDTDICSYLAADRPVSYGYDVSSWGSGDAEFKSAQIDTYVDDFRIYNGMYTAESLYQDYRAKNGARLLETAKTKYINTMAALSSAGYVYRNMKAAFQKYDQICRYEDSILYGNTALDMDKINTLIAEMDTAIAAMTRYTPATKNGLNTSELGWSANQQKIITDGSTLGTSSTYKTSIPEAYTHNLLSGVDIANNMQEKPVDANGTEDTRNYNNPSDRTNTSAAISVPSFVWLYTGIDGDIPTAPVAGYVWKGSSGDRGVEAFFPTSLSQAKACQTNFDNGNYNVNLSMSSDISFTGTWKMQKNHYVTTNAMDYWYYMTSPANWMGHDNTYYRNGNSILSEGTGAFFPDTNKCDIGGNVLQLNLTDIESKFNGGYYYSFIPAYAAEQCRHTTNNYKHTMRPFFDERKPIYVVNFPKFNESITTSAQKYALSHITDYTWSTAEAVLDAYDDLTANVSFLISNPANFTTELESIKSNFNAKVSVINTAVSAVESKSSINDLRNFVKDGSVQNSLYKKGNFYSDTDISAVANNSQYTTSSWSNFTEKYEDIKAFFTNLNPYLNTSDLNDEDHRYTSDVDTLTAYINAANAAYNGLDPVAIYTSIDTAMETDEIIAARATNNYSAGAQINTYDSWIAFASAYAAGETLYNKTRAERNNTPKYTVQASTVNTITTADPSTEQSNINTTATAVTTNYDALTAVDVVAKYETFDAAYTTVCGLNAAKYNTAGTALLNTAKANEAIAYHTLTAEEATTYNSYTGKSLAAGARVKNTDDADSLTSAMLTNIGTLEDANNKATYIKHFTGSVTVKSGEDTVSSDTLPTTYYGEIFDITIPEAAWANNTITLTATDPYNGDAAVGSEKVSYNGYTFSKVATSDIAVTIDITNQTSESDAYKVIIKDIYGTIVQTLYVSLDDINTMMETTGWNENVMLDFGSERTVTANSIPFFSFREWSYAINDSNKTATFRACYNVADSVILTINGADSVSGCSSNDGTEYTTTVDNYVTITNADAYGWATKIGDKYQIAAYGGTMNLYAITNEEFYPIFRNGTVGSYTYTVGSAGGTQLTASNVDFKFDTATLETDAVINQKLTDQNPFIALIDVEIENKPATTRILKGTAYCRVTQNSTYNEAGVIATTSTTKNTDEGMVKSNGIKSYVSTRILPTGQFTYYIYNTTGNGFASLSFRGYVAYDLSYAAAGTTADISVSEYSRRIVTNPAV